LQKADFNREEFPWAQFASPVRSRKRIVVPFRNRESGCGTKLLSTSSQGWEYGIFTHPQSYPHFLNVAQWMISVYFNNTASHYILYVVGEPLKKHNF
jgi:hypothetical protein